MCKSAWEAENFCEYVATVNDIWEMQRIVCSRGISSYYAGLNNLCQTQVCNSPTPILKHTLNFSVLGTSLSTVV